MYAKIIKMLRVFEAFAGYGSQRMALNRCNIQHEVVGISEIEGDAILSYAAIHDNLLDIRHNDMNITDEDMKDYLKSINVPLDYRTFKNKVDSLKGQKLKDMYVANLISKNFGDIRTINPENLPDFDFFTYSFPCQDISVAGYQNGLDIDSGTRSSLLWECCKIIETKKPKYLMMENVKNLVGKNHKKNFEDFLSYLEKLGYTNYWDILNARDYGIPQNRERVFCVSILGDNTNFIFPKKQPLTLKMNDLLEEDVPDNFYLKHNQFTKEPINQEWIYCLDSNYWKGTFLKDFLEKHRRQLVSGKINNNSLYPARRLTPLECWRFMGVTDDDYYKASHLISNTSLYKQAGNSIVVPVLESIFNNLFKEDKKMDKDKELLIQLFRNNVKGKSPDVTGRNINHDGRAGNWLEEQFGKHPDANNHADFFGYELKNETTSKTTFGDWSANRYIFKTGQYASLFKNPSIGTPQDVFCLYFGQPNPEKNNRCSWSGKPIPRLNEYNEFGQIMVIEDNKDIVIKYSFSQDCRANKNSLIPVELQNGEIELARWFGSTSPSTKRTDKSLKDKLEDKFNQKGWFTCKKDSEGKYNQICFGGTFNFDQWLDLVAKGIVFFDSGMYQGNKRPYSQWRANNKYWDSLITERYE
ncbi:TPA: LlaMI family restriction endonuclease [Streptococcus suis]|nr:LlaMI family restriction endonuclease [Streptococcus suis]HEL1599800.1 LlaMI family restriction endonuclease [Streptococcus suis]HEL9645077.1 LlaMI family restriction endonuclease [Streptococcus suis]HEL9645902.1 LlaMI family restriction endonuclease [Streptococcus suis]